MAPGKGVLSFMAAVKLKDLCYTKFAKGAHAPLVLPWFRNTRKETAAMKYGFYMFLGLHMTTVHVNSTSHWRLYN